METYLRALVPALLELDDPPRLVLFANPDGYSLLKEEPWADQVALIECKRFGRAGARMLSELAAVGALADRHGANVIHSIAQTGPLASRAIRVVTLHDTTWITGGGNDPTFRVWCTVVPWVAARSARVIAVSESGAANLVADLGLAAEKIDVIPHGYTAPLPAGESAGREIRERLGLGDGPVVANLGQKRPHRNLPRLLDAFAVVRESFPDAVLVLPGPPHPAAEAQLRERASSLGFEHALVLPGYLSDSDLEGLWAQTNAFVLPSLVEGFGLPVLEALARGVPTACSSDSAPAEVAGDAALRFDPTDMRAIADAILALLSDHDLAARLRSAGPQRAAAFSWSRCAQLTRDSYRRAYAAVR